MTATAKNSTRGWGGAALLCLLVLTALWRHLDRQCAQAALELRALGQEAEALSTATAAVSEQLENAVTAAQAPSTEAPPAPTAPAHSPALNLFDPKLTEQPAYRAALLQLLKTDVNRSFSRLIVQLQLNAQEATQLKRLLTEMRLVEFEVRDAMAEQANSPADPTTARKARSAGMQDIDKEIEALLGPENHQVYQAFYQAKDFERDAEDVRSTLAITDTPLSLSQSDELQQLMGKQRSLGQRRTDFLPDSELQAFLSPAQIEAVHTHTRRLQATAYIAQAMRPARK